MSFKLKDKNGNFTNQLEYVELEVFDKNATQSSTPTLKKFYMETNIQVQPGGTYNNVGFGTLVIPTSGKTLTSIDILDGPNEIEENDHYADYNWKIQANWSDGSSEEIIDTNVIEFEPSTAQYNQDTVRVYIPGYESKYAEKTVVVKKSQVDKCLVTINTTPEVSFTLKSDGAPITSGGYVDLNSTLNISYTADDISKYNISYKMGSTTVYISQSTDVQVTDDIIVSAELKPTDITATWTCSVSNNGNASGDKVIDNYTKSLGVSGSRTADMVIYNGDTPITNMTALRYIEIVNVGQTNTSGIRTLRCHRDSDNGVWTVDYYVMGSQTLTSYFTTQPSFEIVDGKLHSDTFGQTTSGTAESPVTKDAQIAIISQSTNGYKFTVSTKANPD